MRWRQIGPFRAGRVTGVVVLPANRRSITWERPRRSVEDHRWWHGMETDLRQAAGGVDWRNRRSAFQSEHGLHRDGDVSNVGGSVNQGNGMWKSSDAARPGNTSGWKTRGTSGNLGRSTQSSGCLRGVFRSYFAPNTSAASLRHRRRKDLAQGPV